MSIHTLRGIRRRFRRSFRVLHSAIFNLQSAISVLALSLCLAAPAQATLITGVTVTQTNANLNYTHGILVAVANGAGLTGTAPNQVHDDEWLTTQYGGTWAGAPANYGYVTFIFLFTSNQPVGLVEVWNRNRGGYGNWGGLKTADIYTSASTSGDLDWVSQGSQSYTAGPGADGFAGDDFTVSWSNVRRVKIAGTSSYTEDGGWLTPQSGLSEVQFWTPEPATLALLGLGGLGMLLSRKRK